MSLKPLLLPAATVLLAVSVSCTPPEPAPSREVLIWRPVETWSGHGNSQTGSFISETGTFRVRWETKNAGPGGGRFHLVLHSAVSGRPLLDAVDQRGNGRGEVYLQEDPRVFHLVVASEGLDWTFSAEEGTRVTLTGPGSSGRESR